MQRRAIYLLKGVGLGSTGSPSLTKTNEKISFRKTSTRFDADCACRCVQGRLGTQRKRQTRQSCHSQPCNSSTLAGEIAMLPTGPATISYPFSTSVRRRVYHSCSFPTVSGGMGNLGFSRRFLEFQPKKSHVLPYSIPKGLIAAPFILFFRQLWPEPTIVFHGNRPITRKTLK